MLAKQFLIASYILEKLQIVNFIKEGYDNDKAILIDNSFLHFTAHIYYRSSIIDLYTLFGKANRNNENSFLSINESFNQVLKPDSIEVVKEWINNSQGDIMIVKDLRDKEIAHYDFRDKESISLNFDSLSQLNTLHSLAQKIITHYGDSFKNENDSIGFDFEIDYQNLESLKWLVAKAV